MDTFRRGSHTFEVLDGGPADGEVMVLLHGYPQDHHAFDATLPTLHAAGYRTLAPLQRGYSSGARPTGRRDYVGAELTADVIALLDAAGVETAHIVGHDWGGGVAWGVAAAHPDRVRSLVSISTPHPQALMSAGLGQLAKSWYILMYQLPLLPERLVGSAARSGRMAKMLRKEGIPREAAERYAQRMSDPVTLRCAINWYRGLPLSVRDPVGPSTVPTTYIWGKHDAYLGRAAAERTSRHVRADYRFAEIDGQHFLPEVQPDVVAGLILERARGASALAA